MRELTKKQLEKRRVEEANELSERVKKLTLVAFIIRNLLRDSRSASSRILHSALGAN